MSSNLQILTLLSGKGGSGKTVIGMSMARVLTEAGYRVLLVDCDYSTHGATYFFEDELETEKQIYTFENVYSAERIISHSEHQILRTREGFFFIPYTVRLGEKASPPSDEKISSYFASIIGIAVYNDFNAVILDCQAGVSSLLIEALKISTRNLVVLEPDAISTAALRALHLRIGKFLKRSNTWQIFNKITEEERPVYEKLHGGTLFPNLPPLPFDWAVRAAFAKAEIPSVIEKQTAFGLGIMRIMKTLLKPFESALSILEDKAVGKWYNTIMAELSSLEEERKTRIKHGKHGMENYSMIRVVSLLTSLTPFMLFIYVVYLILFNGDSLSRFLGIIDERATRLINFLAIIIFAGISVISYFFFRFETPKPTKPDLSLIISRIFKLENLLNSDSSLKEYHRSKLKQEFEEKADKDIGSSNYSTHL